MPETIVACSSCENIPNHPAKLRSYEGVAHSEHFEGHRSCAALQRSVSPTLSVSMQTFVRHFLGEEMTDSGPDEISDGDIPGHCE